jgi:hypothetical protein
MNRRRLFTVLGLASLVPMLGHNDATVREVVFAPPKEPPTIYWRTGHVTAEEFMALHSEVDTAAQPSHLSHIKYGWATRKLSWLTMYLSDTQLENFEPITYYIPGDYA